ncbi:nicotinamidase/pyrazinamidase [candidate division SR1 bacterium Aalborg_AAW-1]|nr:nicotinamidase/pyrazinamidase [candidate division SR1 bacterium Aalborg_AAW-1]
MKPNNGIALLSIDNIKTFEDKTLHELYVPNGELVAQQTKTIINICQNNNLLIINVFESHPNGHISFASSYKDKQPFDMISYDEIQHRTNEKNRLSDTAAFGVDQLKSYLQSRRNQTDTLRPDHARSETNSHELMPPLTPELFDIHISKGHQVDKHPYGGFGGTDLNDVLRKHRIHSLIITGVATDYCIQDTVLEALAQQYKTYLITDAIASISPEQGNIVQYNLQQQGAILITSQELEALLSSYNSNIS